MNQCAAPGCDQPRYEKNRSAYCPKHIWRLRTHGSFDLPPRPPAKPDRSGYIKRGGDWEHRIVLKAVIGLDPHPCHWCNRMLAWGVDLFVDHLDDNRLNNDPHNLVPSCNRCNAWRNRQPATHCKRGHEFDQTNTYVNATSGSRVCRICSAKCKADWQRRKRAAARLATT